MELPWHAVLAGIVAGLAVAVPLGAIGVLILRQGLVHGWRTAAAAATGVALVDVGYAGAATAAGTALSRALTPWTRPVQLLGAAVLLGVAAHGLLGLRHRTAPPSPSAAPASSASGDGDDPVRVLGRFVALTAINPLTAVYFVVLAAGLGTTLAGRSAAVAFVVGVLVGSLAWQLVLAAFGTLAGARLPEWARTATCATGYLMVVGYAVRLAVG